MSEVMPERVARPPDTGADPRTLLPSATNWTVPVGVPAPGAVTVTVAVKLTGPRAVAVPAVVTVWPSPRLPVLAAYVLLPV